MCKLHGPENSIVQTWYSCAEHACFVNLISVHRWWRRVEADHLCASRCCKEFCSHFPHQFWSLLISIIFRYNNCKLLSCMQATSNLCVMAMNVEKIADKYDIPSLAQIVLDELGQRISSRTALDSNIWQIAERAVRWKNTTVLDICMDSAAYPLESAQTQCNGFMQLPDASYPLLRALARAVNKAAAKKAGVTFTTSSMAQYVNKWNRTWSTISQQTQQGTGSRRQSGLQWFQALLWCDILTRVMLAVLTTYKIRDHVE